MNNISQISIFDYTEIENLGDLAKLKLHYVELEFLEGEQLKAADIDGDGEITIRDIAQLKLALVGLIELK